MMREGYEHESKPERYGHEGANDGVPGRGWNREERNQRSERRVQDAP